MAMQPQHSDTSQPASKPASKKPANLPRSQQIKPGAPWRTGKDAPKGGPHPAGPQRTNIERRAPALPGGQIIPAMPEPEPPAPIVRANGFTAKALAKPAPQKPTPCAVRWWTRKDDGATVAVIEANDNGTHSINMQGTGIAERSDLAEATKRAADYLATIGPIDAFRRHDAN